MAFDTKRDGSYLRVGDVNQLMSFIKGLDIRGVGGCNVSRPAPNRFLIQAAQQGTLMMAVTSNDPASAPNYPIRYTTPMANTYYAQITAIQDNPIDSSGNNTITWTPVANSYDYILNLAQASLVQASTGVGYIPVGTQVLVFPVGSQLCCEYFGDEILFGQVYATIDSPQASGNVSLGPNSLNWQQQNGTLLNVTDNGGGDAWVVQSDSLTWKWDEVQTPSDALFIQKAFTPGYAQGVPATSISAVVLTVFRSASEANDVKDLTVQLLLNGVPTGPNKAATGYWPTTSTPKQYVWFVPSDQTLAPSDVENSNFGVQFIAQSNQLGTASLKVTQLAVEFSPLTVLIQSAWTLPANQLITAVNRTIVDYGPQIHQGTLATNIVPGSTGVVTVTDTPVGWTNMGNVAVNDTYVLGGLVGQTVAIYWNYETGVFSLLTPTCPC
jgi:hypothetical protein